MIKKKILLGVLFTLCVAGFSSAQEYIVGEGDVLEIRVYDNDDLNKWARVSGNNTITVPLIGEVDVRNLTVNQVAKKISELLADGYLVEPHVSVFIKEYRSKKAHVLGEVIRPGVLELRGKRTLLELISKAGGWTKDAGEKIILKRKPKLSGEYGGKIIEIDRKLLIQGEESLNYTIEDGDYIIVEKADPFYVEGEVRRGGKFNYEEGITVIQAISMAGGFSPKASSTKVKVIRTIDGKKKVLEKVNMDLPVYPKDVIIVPESFF